MYEGRWWEAYRLVQNHGRGLLMQGGCDWTDYTVSSTITLHMAEAAGLAARVGGMRRYYALLLHRDGKAQLIRALDGDTVLAEAPFAWEFGETHDFALTVKGTQITAAVDGKTLFTVQRRRPPRRRHRLGRRRRPRHDRRRSNHPRGKPVRVGE